MRTITAAVKQIIERDPIAYEALGRGLLNANAYARSIQSEIKAWCFKDVKINTIVTVLVRLAAKIRGMETLSPAFKMEAITVKVGLTETAYSKGMISKSVSRWLQNQKRMVNEFFLTIEGATETSFIFPERLLPVLKKQLRTKQALHGCVTKLAAITLSCSSTLTFVPNVGYTLMRALALRHINVVEVISSYSEVSFLVDEADLQPSLDALKAFL